MFHNDGNEECYISSADLMTRNIERRIEVTCPIWDPALKKELRDIFRIQWRDNVKAREIDSSRSNKRVKNKYDTNRSQECVMNYLIEKGTKKSGEEK